jgi:cytochrome o ubiquinol oxidase operon protein cyoD
MSHGEEFYEDIDTAPGDDVPDGHDLGAGLRTYIIGFSLASLLTVISFALPSTGFIWGPSLPVALVVLAIAQMGVHLVFFLHITTGPDNTNNVLALAFGVLIVFLVIGGSIWIMAHLNHNNMPMDMEMHR